METYSNTMPQEYKDLWIHELRSGKYNQGVGQLFCAFNDSYCCLGVLQKCIEGQVEYLDKMPQALPSESWVVNHQILWLNERNEYLVFPMLKHNGKWFSAHDLNDTVRLSFSEIADLIEEQIIGI